MNKALLLCLVLLCATVVFTAEDLKEDYVPEKRAAACYCKGKAGRGDKWILRGTCPGGYGYNNNCYQRPNVCCYPQYFG
uniref:Kappa-actitoxin-Ate Potassium channel toxin type 3 BDS n=1 Tax=Actinia tenebrosa TaxID=6105 RepID=A0A3P8MJV7_ACTTE|nr:Kappa-actitoxin-Ate Potassium channel toxin type 3 BDS [Actinia tenebrosa]